MDFASFLDSKAGTNALGSLAGGIGKGLGDAIGGGQAVPMISGGPVDSRSFMDGSGWTVATGGSKTTGATIQGREGFGASVTQMPQSAYGGAFQSGGMSLAGFSGSTLSTLMLLGLVFAVWRSR